MSNFYKSTIVRTEMVTALRRAANTFKTFYVSSVKQRPFNEQERYSAGCLRIRQISFGTQNTQYFMMERCKTPLPFSVFSFHWHQWSFFYYSSSSLLVVFFFSYYKALIIYWRKFSSLRKSHEIFFKPIKMWACRRVLNLLQFLCTVYRKKYFIKKPRIFKWLRTRFSQPRKSTSFFSQHQYLRKKNNQEEIPGNRRGLEQARSDWRCSEQKETPVRNHFDLSYKLSKVLIFLFVVSIITTPLDWSLSTY